MNKFRELGFIGCNRQFEAHPSLLNVVMQVGNQNKVVVNIDQSRSRSHDTLFLGAAYSRRAS
jgi:hypothetical protein